MLFFFPFLSHAFLKRKIGLFPSYSCLLQSFLIERNLNLVFDDAPLTLHLIARSCFLFMYEKSIAFSLYRALLLQRFWWWIEGSGGTESGRKGNWSTPADKFDRGIQSHRKCGLTFLAVLAFVVYTFQLLFDLCFSLYWIISLNSASKNRGWHKSSHRSWGRADSRCCTVCHW